MTQRKLHVSIERWEGHVAHMGESMGEYWVLVFREVSIKI